MLDTDDKILVEEFRIEMKRWQQEGKFTHIDFDTLTDQEVLDSLVPELIPHMRRAAIQIRRLRQRPLGY